jgi:hypothetical protein
MSSRALLIGVSKFADRRLARLTAPMNDVKALGNILKDTSRGAFDQIEYSLDQEFLDTRDQISSLFVDSTPDDLLLLYYSGHGVLGRGNRLFLAAADSNLDLPRRRSISAEEIQEFVRESRAARHIIMLDCCHSGAFAEHGKAGGPPPAVTGDTFSTADDAGLYVLTASDTLQFAWDGAELRTGDPSAQGFSQFTSWLVDGLERGEAAPDDECITMDALYRYVLRRARGAGAAATPQRFVRGGVGDLIISQNPLASSLQIDAETVAALTAAEWRTRLGAVTDLLSRMSSDSTGAPTRAARRLLQNHLQQERDFAVRTAIINGMNDIVDVSVHVGSLVSVDRSDKPGVDTVPPAIPQHADGGAQQQALVAPSDTAALASDDRVAPRPLRYGDRVTSEAMGDGMVAGTEPGSGSVIVVFARDHIQRKMPVDALRLSTKPPETSVKLPNTNNMITVIAIVVIIIAAFIAIVWTTSLHLSPR